MRTAAGLATVLILFSNSASASMSEAGRCERAKMLAAARYGRCIQIKRGMESRGGTPDYADCSTRLAGAFARAESRANGTCPTMGDVSAIQARLEGIWNPNGALPQWFAGNRFVLNGITAGLRTVGDGTVTDTLTGLMWEVKTTEPGSGENFDDPHDVDNFYTIGTLAPDGSVIPSGTAQTDFIPKLNNCVSTEEASSIVESASDSRASLPRSTTTGGFAGHCDWRLPTLDELTALCDQALHGEFCFPSALNVDPRAGSLPEGPAVYSAYWRSLIESFPADPGFGIGPNNMTYVARARTTNGGTLNCQNATAASCRARVIAVRNGP